MKFSAKTTGAKKLLPVGDANAAPKPQPKSESPKKEATLVDLFDTSPVQNVGFLFENH
jgi:hypothetical protein